MTRRMEALPRLIRAALWKDKDTHRRLQGCILHAFTDKRSIMFHLNFASGAPESHAFRRFTDIVARLCRLTCKCSARLGDLMRARTMCSGKAWQQGASGNSAPCMLQLCLQHAEDACATPRHGPEQHDEWVIDPSRQLKMQNITVGTASMSVHICTADVTEV